MCTLPTAFTSKDLVAPRGAASRISYVDIVVTGRMTERAHVACGRSFFRSGTIGSDFLYALPPSRAGPISRPHGRCGTPAAAALGGDRITGNGEW